MNTLERTAVDMDDSQKTANVDNATTGAGSSQLQVFPLERAECGERGGEHFFLFVLITSWWRITTLRIG